MKDESPSSSIRLSDRCRLVDPDEQLFNLELGDAGGWSCGEVVDCHRSVLWVGSSKNLDGIRSDFPRKPFCLPPSENNFSWYSLKPPWSSRCNSVWYSNPSESRRWLSLWLSLLLHSSLLLFPSTRISRIRTCSKKLTRFFLMLLVGDDVVVLHMLCSVLFYVSRFVADTSCSTVCTGIM